MTYINQVTTLIFVLSIIFIHIFNYANAYTYKKPTVQHLLYSKYDLTLLSDIKLNQYLKQDLIVYYIKQYTKNKELLKLLKRSKILLQYVMLELHKRNLPKELVLLPIVESSYRPMAVSNKGATGIWQISYVAGQRYGLIMHNHNSAKIIDSRYDIAASTQAALSYLEYLYKRFNNDWLLALAAYNAGEGRVSQAIKKNLVLHKNASFWSLTLPEETQHYVPKLLALSIIFNHPEKYGFELLDL